MSKKLSKKSHRSKKSEKACTCSDVLIVDDEIFNITAMKFLLKKHKINADSCLNGKECIEKLKRKVKVDADAGKEGIRLFLWIS